MHKTQTQSQIALIICKVRLKRLQLYPFSTRDKFSLKKHNQTIIFVLSPSKIGVIIYLYKSYKNSTCKEKTTTVYKVKEQSHRTHYCTLNIAHGYDFVMHIALEMLCGI